MFGSAEGLAVCYGKDVIYKSFTPLTLQRVFFMPQAQPVELAHGPTRCLVFRVHLPERSAIGTMTPKAATPIGMLGGFFRGPPK
jgi:hypothetical protein